MAYNNYETMLGGGVVTLQQRAYGDSTQWNRLNKIFSEAILDDKVCDQLLKGDPNLFTRHQINGDIQVWVRQLEAKTLDVLAQRILNELGN